MEVYDNKIQKLSKNIKFDKTTGEFIKPTLLLQTRNGKLIGKIKYDNFTASLKGNSIDEISFDVHKYVNGEKCAFWEELKGLKIINYKDYGLFQAKFTINEENETIKTCVAQSLEVELSQRKLRDFHVNDEEAITTIDTGDKFTVTVFCNKNDTTHSLLHRAIAEKAPHWSIGYVTDLLNINGYVYSSSVSHREFTIDDKDIYSFLTDDVANEFNVIFYFDTYNRRINCYNAEECIYNQKTMKVVEGGYKLGGIYYGYDENGNVIALENQSDYMSLGSIGNDTHILLSTNKLAKSLQLEEDSDSLKNTFYISGGDDVITNYVAAANITGNNYITIFSNFQTDEMSDELKSLIKNYNKLLESSEESFNGLGGVYIYNSNYVYDGVNAKNKDTQQIITDFKLDSKNRVYTVDTCAYVKNGKVYDKDDNLLTSGYILDDDMGLFTKLCHLTDRYYYLNDSKFPDTSIPDTTANEQLVNLRYYFEQNAVMIYNSVTTDSFETAQNTIKTMIGVVCDSRYTIKILSSENNTSTETYKDSYISNDINDTTTSATWYGIILLQRTTDENDIRVGELSVRLQKIKLEDIDTNNKYCEQKMKIAISKMSIADLDFKNYTTESELINFFKQYNLTTLKSYKEAFNSCLCALEDAYSNSQVENIKLSDGSSYQTLHDTYSLRATACEKVFLERDKQVKNINSQIDTMNSLIAKFRERINMESYFKNPDNGGSEELWKEYNMYIREDTYNNSNYISDGLSDSELLTKAKELISVAKKELKKACVAQKSISGSINNIFTQRELEQLYDNFSLFNYVRCKINDHIYKLRLIEVELHESDLSQINCTFAENVEDVTGVVSNVKSILEQAQSMATSYSSTTKQAIQGASALDKFTTMKREGLDSAEYVIKNSNSEEVLIDNNGINCKSMNDIGSYGNHQCRLTGNGLYLTDDAWEHVRSAIGLMKFNNEWMYGIIADCIIGNFIVGQNVSVSNKSGSVEITGDGITLDGGAIRWKKKLPTSSVEGLDDTVKDFVDAIGDLQSQIDGEITSWFEEYEPTTTNAPASTWTTDAEKIKHEGDLFYNTATGAAYRYIYNSSTKKHEWSIITDTAITEALEKASKAQDTADGKRRVFVIQPTPPYDVGDLWSQGSDGDLMKCKIAKSKEQSYSPDDWEKASKYTDDTKAKKVEQDLIAYEKEINSFKDKVNTALTGSTTEIGSDYVISPKIGGGYLYIKNKNDERSVTIDPQESYSSNNYIFKVTDKNGNITIGADSDGAASFNGSITASSGKIGGWIINPASLYCEGYEVNGVKTKVLLDTTNGMIQVSGYNGSVHLGGFLNPEKLYFVDANNNTTCVYQTVSSKNVPVLYFNNNIQVGADIYTNSVTSANIYTNSVTSANGYYVSNGMQITSGTVGTESAIVLDGSTGIMGNLSVNNSLTVNGGVSVVGGVSSTEFVCNGMNLIKQLNGGDGNHNIYLYWSASAKSLCFRVDDTYIGSIHIGSDV